MTAIIKVENQDETQGDFGLVTKEAVRVKRPAKYQVVLLNDDFTPMEYVVNVLRNFFFKSEQEATVIMLKVHQEGRAVVGVYTREIAETKVAIVMEDARKHGYPLQAIMEKT